MLSILLDYDGQETVPPPLPMDHYGSKRQVIMLLNEGKKYNGNLTAMISFLVV